MLTRDLSSETTSRPKSVSTNTVVIGAGPAGLAVGGCLKRAGIPFLLLEQSDRIGQTWHRHYDRLHLHTPKAHSALPYFPFPKHCPRYPSRLQFLDYLEAYRQHFPLEPLFGQQVEAACYRQPNWEIQTQEATYQAPHLVVATGYNRVPQVPAWAGQNLFKGAIIHSSDYKNGSPFKNKRVLVVGFGNSGGEIAIDLYESGAQPSLAVRNPVNVIPRDLFGIPVLTLGLLFGNLPPQVADTVNAPLLRLAIGDFTRYGLRRLPYGPLIQIKKFGKIPLIDVGTIKLIQQGYIAVYPGIDRFTEEEVFFTDGKKGKFDAVVLATGYRAEVNFLKPATACDRNGTPSASGREGPVPGLYFCGFQVSPTGMLREIGLEARQISSAIAQKTSSQVMA